MIFKVLILLLLIIVNGIFSATEIAFLSINKYELNKEVKKGNKKALKIVDLINDSSSFLSAIQIAITLSGFLASVFAAESFAGELAVMLNFNFIKTETLTTILIVLITLILSYFTLVFGELVPKKVGIAYSTQISFKMVFVITLLIKIFKPFIVILKGSTDLVIKTLGVKKVNSNIENELKSTIVDSSLEELEKQLLLNVFKFNDTTLKEVMTKKEDVISISPSSSQEEIIKIIKTTKFTRFPIVDKDKVIGIINVKDLIINHTENFALKNYLRHVITLDSDMIIDDAFLYLNANYEAFAVVETNGQYVGIVTIEDIIEDVIGNIFDEYDNK